MTNYVSAVPLKELGLGLGIEHLGDEQAQELTDDYSLPALKVRPEGKPGASGNGWTPVQERKGKPKQYRAYMIHNLIKVQFV